MKKNSRKNFYKYISADVAKLIISNQSLRWSCPRLFNDPFDHRFNIFNVEPDKFKNAFFSEYKSLIFDENEVVIDTSTEIGWMLNEIRNNKHNLPKDEFSSYIEKTSEDFTLRFSDSLKNAESDFNSFIDRTTVLCLAEEPDNLLMWAHYGPSHTGAVLRLNVVESLDVNLSLARKVVYDSKYPLMATQKEWIDRFLCVNRFDVWERYYSAICTKSIDWSYEKEWRISLYEEKNEPLSVRHMFYPKEVFGAIYLGQNMSISNKQEIVTLSERKLPNMEIWEASIDDSSFKLNYTRLK